MGLSMTLWGTEYSLIAATPYYYNTNGTTAVSVTTRYADGYSTFTTGGDMTYLLIGVLNKLNGYLRIIKIVIS